MVRGEDDYTMELETDRKTALWRAELSDGSVVCMDDHRPGVQPHSAWVRLAEHVGRTGLRIRRLWLQFRSNHKRDILPADADGYFFCKSALGSWGNPETFSFYLVGYLQSEKLVVQRWSVPDLNLVDAEERDPARAGDCLIRNPRNDSDPGLVKG